MARLTAAQRREAEELAHQERRTEALRFQKEEAPMLLLMIMCRAQELGVDYMLKGPVTNLELKLLFNRYDDRDEQWVDEHELGLTSESWKFDQVTTQFERIVEERAAAARKLETARAAYDKLTPEERDALKLKYRP